MNIVMSNEYILAMHGILISSSQIICTKVRSLCPWWTGDKLWEENVPFGHVMIHLLPRYLHILLIVARIGSQPWTLSAYLTYPNTTSKLRMWPKEQIRNMCSPWYKNKYNKWTLDHTGERGESRGRHFSSRLDTAWNDRRGTCHRRRQGPRSQRPM